MHRNVESDLLEERETKERLERSSRVNISRLENRFKNGVDLRRAGGFNILQTSIAFFTAKSHLKEYMTETNNLRSNVNIGRVSLTDFTNMFGIEAEKRIFEIGKLSHAVFVDENVTRVQMRVGEAM